jgi:type I restriction enzyme S subunit
MNLETFFGKFELFADAPDAVKKMRELVLELAVRGKLVNQRSDDGTAAQLLAAISDERDSQVVKLRKPAEPTLAEVTAHAFVIPSNWVWTKLGSLALQIQYGYTASADPSATEIRMLRITDIQNDRVDWPSVPGCHIEANEAERYLLSSNDILIARTGGTIGKSFFVPDAPVKSVFASYLIRVTPPQSIEARYLKIFLGAPLYWKQLRQMSAGTGQPNVNGQALGRLEIPLPPLAEQRRIVAKVDELMALCDRLDAQQQEREERHAALARASLARFAEAPTPANLHFLFHPSYAIPPADLRKSILTLAVQGKLVPQDPNDEPAEDILARMAATKLQLQTTGEIGKEKPGELLQPDRLPFEVPYAWRWAKLAEITELITKGSSPKWQGISYVSESEGILFITSENVGNYGLRKLDDLKYVSKGFNEIEPRSILKRGDILMNLVGASIGRTAVYDLHDGANINQAVALIRVVRETDGICPRFLLHYLNSPSAIEYMLSSRVVNAQPNISLTDAREFAVPIPPLAEQRRIVAKVEQLMALVDALEKQLQESRERGAKLLEALVAELTAG